jgi:hypothetical protein
MRRSPGCCLFFILLVASCAPSSVRAQSRAAEIRNTFGRYWDAVQRKDHEATLAFIDPKLFTLVPREKVLAALERSNADTTVRVSWGEAEVTKVSKPVKDKDLIYALVDYRFGLRMQLSSEPDTDEERKASFLIGVLEEQYGKGNVQVDAAGVYAIQAQRSMIAVLDPQIGDWRFLERKPAMEPLLEQLVPKSVLKELK